MLPCSHLLTVTPLYVSAGRTGCVSLHVGLHSVIASMVYNCVFIKNRSILVVNTAALREKFTIPAVNHISVLKQYVSVFK